MTQECINSLHVEKSFIFCKEFALFFQQGEKEKGSLAIYYEFFAQTALFFLQNICCVFFKEKHSIFFKGFTLIFQQEKSNEKFFSYMCDHPRCVYG